MKTLISVGARVGHEVKKVNCEAASSWSYFWYENGDLPTRRHLSRRGATGEADAEIPQPALCRSPGQYLARHAPDEVTEAMNRVVERLGEPRPDPLLAVAARRTFERAEW